MRRGATLATAVYNPGGAKSRQPRPRTSDHRDRSGALHLRLYDVIWNERFVAKIAEKHAVNTDEVAERESEGRALVRGLWSDIGGAIPCGILYLQAARRGVADFGAGNDRC